MQSNWQDAFFRGVALEFWQRVTTAEQTQAEVVFLKYALGLAPGGEILDVPCGLGRHAIELAKQGYRMTGIDRSQECVDRANRAAGDSGLGVRWLKADMCRLPGESTFDGAYCFGNSFGYLDRGGAREFLSGIARSLKPGCRFALETGMAAESLLPNLTSRRWYRAGDIFMLSENQYHPNDSRLEIQYTFIQGGRVETRPSASYVLTVAEICQMHGEAGLEVIELMGSISGEPYRVGSPALLVISRSAVRSGMRVPHFREATPPAPKPEAPPDLTSGPVEFGGFYLLLDSRLLFYHGERIPVAPRIADLLCMLVTRHGQLLSKDELMRGVWGDSFVEESNLSKAIFILRRCLARDVPGKTYIETVPKRGYRLVGEVRRSEARGSRRQTNASAEAVPGPRLVSSR